MKSTLRGHFFVFLLACLSFVSGSMAQSCQGVTIELGPVVNAGTAPAVLATHLLQISSSWRSARLYFKSDEILPSGTFLRITAIDDSAQQLVDSSEIADWRYTTAYFNTGTTHQLLLELVCAPHTSANYIKVIEVCPGPPIARDPAKNLCLPQPPNSAAPWAARLVGRLDALTCSSAMYSTRGCLISAQHCSHIVGDVAQFNVPDSAPTGHYVHPAPAHQYIISAILQAGPGDWAVIKLGKRGGLTAY